MPVEVMISAFLIGVRSIRLAILKILDLLLDVDEKLIEHPMPISVNRTMAAAHDRRM